MNAPREALETPAANAAPEVPLVVDLDGTLTPTDTLLEAAVRGLRRRPGDLLRWPLWLAAGRAAFKQRVVAASGWQGEHIPLREEFVQYLAAQRRAGRRIVLATAADRAVAEQVAARVGLFDAVIASDGLRNLKGLRKLEAIRECVGEDFAYAGDSSADLPIWQAAKGAVLVGPSRGVFEQARRVAQVEREFPAPRPGLRLWLKALRVHQWLKNVLIFVPLLTSFTFLDPRKLGAALAAFFAFSLVASATYLLNDLWDLDADRQHARKRHRPLASGQLGIAPAVAAAAALLAAGLGLGAVVGAGFFATVGIYLVSTTAYSWVFKRYVLADAMGLALLYMLRILAGAVAIGVAVSNWLLAFSVFFFLSLALIKRCSELVSLQQEGRVAASGRDYRVSDLTVLWPLGAGSALAAAVVFGLFVSAPEVHGRYASPGLLWLVDMALLYWLSRLWIKTSRGEMEDDPVVFAVRDGASLVIIVVAAVIAAVAYFVPL